MAKGAFKVISIQALAAELKLHVVSVREHCRTRGIPLHRRLPAGARGGQLQSHIAAADARAVRDHYADRLRG